MDDEMKTEPIYVVELSEKERKLLLGITEKLCSLLERDSSLNERKEAESLKRTLLNADMKTRFTHGVNPSKENYPNSLMVKSGLRPIADLEPWVHNDSLSDHDIRLMGKELEDPMAHSEGHKKTLRVMRQMWDKINALQNSG